MVPSMPFNSGLCMRAECAAGTAHDNA